jgi:pilus assembly protein Flp/PilA
MKAMRAVKRFLRDEKGTETLEWAIIIGIIAVGAIAFIVSIGGWVKTKFGTLDATLKTVP